jgi:hypothetical protein
MATGRPLIGVAEKLLSIARIGVATKEILREGNLNEAAVFRTKLIGRAPEVSAEVRHTVQVCADGCSGEVAALQLLKHELT